MHLKILIITVNLRQIFVEKSKAGVLIGLKQAIYILRWFKVFKYKNPKINLFVKLHTSHLQYAK